MVILSYNSCHRVLTQIVAREVGTATGTRSVVLTLWYGSYVGRSQLDAMLSSSKSLAKGVSRLGRHIPSHYTA